MKRITKIRIKRKLPFVLITGMSLIAVCCLASEDIEEETFSAQIKTDVVLNAKEPVSGSLLGLQDDSRFKGYDLSLIELNGSISSVEKEGFGIDWNELRNIQNDRFVGLPVPMTTEDKTNGEVLEQNKIVPITGARNQLVTVLPVLFDNAVTTNKPEETDGKQGDVTVIPAVGSDKEEGINDKYDSSAIDVNEKPEDEIAFNLEACPIRIDWENELVYSQNEVVKSVNGVETERQGCQDADFPVEIIRSYNECGDDVVLPEMKVYKMYKPYYLADGEQKFLKDCTRDNELSYEIKESLFCTPLIDMKQKNVKELSSLYYTDDTARDITVSECQERETTRTFDLKFTYDTCSYRLDSEDGVAYQQGKYVYDKDDVRVDVTPCQDSEKTYEIKNEFCFYRENMVSKKMIRYERQKLHTINGIVYINECQPVGQTDIIETVDGCDTLHTDDFNGGFSYGWSRYYYVDKDDRTNFITECAVSSTFYPHQAVIEDWSVDFDAQTATSLIAYYIDLPSGRTKISEAAVTKHSMVIPLAKQSEEIVDTGEISYDGCLENEKQQIKTGYLLPNGETVYQFVDLAEPKSRYICQDETQTAGVGVYAGWYKKRPSKFKSHVTYYNQGAYYYKRTKSYNPVTKQYICSPWTYTGQSIGGSRSCSSAACSGPACQGIQYDAGGGTCVSNAIQPNLPCE